MIGEAMIMKPAENLFVDMHPIIRKAEEPQAGDVGSSRCVERSPVEPATWKLVFRNPSVRCPIHSGMDIKDVNGGALEIILVDADTGSSLQLPQLLQIELVLVRSYFTLHDREEWSADEFSRVVLKYDGLSSYLTGDVSLTMQDGCVTVNNLRFWTTSYVPRSREFRIGVRVVPGSHDGARIREGVTEAFVVKGGLPGGGLEKHYPPLLGDEVWRLRTIEKDSLHRNLEKHNVNNVQDFLRMLSVKPKELQAILGMRSRMWGMTTKHAKTCVPDNKVYVHSGPQGTIYVDSICQLRKIEFDGEEFTIQQLNEDQRAYVRQLWLEAYEQRNNLKDIPALLNAEPLVGASSLWQKKPTTGLVSSSRYVKR